MTVNTQKIAGDWKAYVTVANIVLVVGLIVSVSRWAQRVDSDIVFLKDHSDNSDVHMPFEKKVELFVPRVELDSKFESLSRQLDRIEDKLDKK
jgi:hypothetical protein